MPGIVGFLKYNVRCAEREALSDMVKTMLHEPFYRSSLYTNSEMGLAIGWVGPEWAFSAGMPIWNDAKNICLMFTGEEYSDPGQLHWTAGQGQGSRTCRAEYLVRLYEKFGDDFFGQLNGQFSGVLVDLREKVVTIFNDRYGLGRLYYSQSHDGFYFASEAKALLKVLPESKELDLVALGEWFSCGCPLNNKTLFKGLALLPGGSRWRFDRDGSCVKQSYFSAEEWENQDKLGEVEYYACLKETFARVLPRYCPENEKVAISLTGGVDSRLIMGWDRHKPGALPCYTFGGMFRECKDVSIAKQVAYLCGQPHSVIPVAAEYLSQFQRLAEQTVFYTDGCMDVSASPDLYANRLARQIAPIRLTGNYGGEILRSIVAFKPMPIESMMFQGDFGRLVEAGRNAYFRELGNSSRLGFIAFKQVPWHHYSRLSLESSQLTVRSPYLDNEVVSLAFRAPGSKGASTETFLRLIGEGNSALGSMGTDRNVMMGSRSLRDSLNHWLQEFSFRTEYAFDYGMPHWLVRLDSLVQPLRLERAFLGRHKFYHFRLWYRNQLSQYVKDVLLDPRARARSYLNGKSLEKIVISHTSGTGNFTLEIHRVLTAELVQRMLIEA